MKCLFIYPSNSDLELGPKKHIKYQYLIPCGNFSGFITEGSIHREVPNIQQIGISTFGIILIWSAIGAIPVIVTVIIAEPIIINEIADLNSFSDSFINLKKILKQYNAKNIA